mmetsp:Transcript_19902/g.25750  ORF Transcript_19902/g.25750 Transcript_19902/m.25750 type:complete len:307 (+) Transcript_19902:54-974(+)
MANSPILVVVIAALLGCSSAFFNQMPLRAGKTQIKSPNMLRMAEDSPLTKVVLKNGNSEAEIYALGACVTSFKVDGYDYLFCRPDAKFDGSKPISGGLPFCWPQFGPGAIQQHGFARNLEWEVVEEQDSTAVFKLLPNDETKAMWNKDFELTYTVSLAPGKLSTVFNVANTGSEDFEFTGALHSYYRTSAVEKIAVKGPFKGASFLDKTLDPPSMVEETNEDITVSAFIERIYPGVSSGISLEDPEAGKTLKIINKQGYQDTVVWNPYGDEGMGASNFLCIESANVMEPITVSAGGNWVGELELEG